MGTQSNWQFAIHFNNGIELACATAIGRNLADAVTRFAVKNDRDHSRVRTHTTTFFLQYLAPTEVVVNEIRTGKANLSEVDDVNTGFHSAMFLSDWSGIGVVVAFGSERGKTIDEAWNLKVRVHEDVIYEFSDPHSDRNERIRPPNWTPCPKPVLLESDFKSLREWHLYADMMRLIPPQVERVHGAEFRYGRYWSFNLSVMCHMFASSVSGVTADGFCLDAPDRTDTWKWDRNGILVSTEKDERFYALAAR